MSGVPESLTTWLGSWHDRSAAGVLEDEQAVDHADQPVTVHVSELWGAGAEDGTATGRRQRQAGRGPNRPQGVTAIDRAVAVQIALLVRRIRRHGRGRWIGAARWCWAGSRDGSRRRRG